MYFFVNRNLLLKFVHTFVHIFHTNLFVRMLSEGDPFFVKKLYRKVMNVDVDNIFILYIT